MSKSKKCNSDCNIPQTAQEAQEESASLKPVKKEDILPYDVLAKPDDVRQLEADVINVVEGRVDICSFPEAYRKKIKNYYRFAATRSNILATSRAQMDRRTQQIM